MSVYEILFSPTGGTKKAADLMMGELASEWEVMDLAAKDEPFAFRSEDLCLVAVPSFSGRVPKTAAERLRHLRGFGARAVLLVAYGNRAYDDTLLDLRDILSQTGFQCCAAVAAVTEHSVVRRFGAGRPDAGDQEKLRGFAREIRRTLEEKEPPRELNVPGNRPYRAAGSVAVRPKTSSKCNGCRICALECPTGAIKATDPRETSLSRCIGCMRCVQVCPQNARVVSKLAMLLGTKTLEKACSERKEPELFL